MSFKSAFFATAVLTASLLLASNAAAQTPPTTSPVARMVVTAVPSHDASPDVAKQDVTVQTGREKLTVADWVAATGNHAGLQLFILIDDGSSTDLANQFGSIGQFIAGQDPTTLVGIAYMRNGTANILQNPTNNHDQAAKALRIPTGIAGANSSPYFSLSDLVKRWPGTKDRREVVMFTSGVDGFWSSGMQDPYVETAISDAQRAGIVVFSIYTPHAGMFGRSYWRNWWGQNYLSELSDRTGGEAYYIGFSGPPVSVEPFLKEINVRLSHQYWLAFVPKPEKKAGLQPVRVSTELKDVELAAADRAYVPASRATPE